MNQTLKNNKRKYKILFVQRMSCTMKSKNETEDVRDVLFSTTAYIKILSYIHYVWCTAANCRNAAVKRVDDVIVVVKLDALEYYKSYGILPKRPRSTTSSF